jgi:hypothetical protein
MLDVQPPTVALDDGWHGALLNPGLHAITGTVSDNRTDIHTVRVNGKPTQVIDGRFTIKQRFQPGVHTIRVVASDRVGNQAGDSISMIVGDVETFDESIEDAAAVQLGQRVLDMVSAEVNGSMAANLGIQEGDPFSPFGACFALEGIVDDVVASDRVVRLSTDPVEQLLYLDISYQQVSVAFSGLADVCGISEPFNAEIIAQNPSMRVSLAPVGEEGTVGFVIEGVETTIGNYLTNVGSLEDDLAAWGYSAEELRIDDTLSQAFVASLGDEDLFAQDLGDMLADIGPSIRLPGTARLHTHFNIHDIYVEEYGMSVEFDAVQPRWGGVPMAGAREWVRIASDLPEAENADATVAISIDTVNHALFSAWYAGNLEKAANLPHILGKTVVRTTATMPPVMLPAQNQMQLVFSGIAVEVTEVGLGGAETVVATAQAFVEQQIQPNLSRSGLKIDFVSSSEAPLTERMRHAAQAQVVRMLNEAMPAPVKVPQGFVANPIGNEAIGQGWIRMDLNVIP